MPLGLGSNLSKTGLTTPGIVTDSLVLKHNYTSGSVIPVSDGAAYFVPGNNDYVAIGNQSNLSFGTGSFSVSSWVNTKQTGTTSFVLGKGSNTSTASSVGYALYLGNTGTDWVFSVGDGTDYEVVETTVAASTNQWYHLCGTFNGTSKQLKLYVDGVLVETDADTDIGDIDNSDAFDIGRLDANATGDWDGYICNVGVWSAVLTQTEVKSIMNKNYAGLISSETTNLVSWWNLDEGITTDGSVTFALDEHTTTLTTAPNQTWAVQSGSPTVNGQEITFTAGESQQVGCTLSTGAGNYKVNMTVSDYSGSGTISLLWDGGGSSDLRTTGNGTFEWVTYLDSSPNILKDSGAAGKVTVNSIKKYDGNTGEFK